MREAILPLPCLQGVVLNSTQRRPYFLPSPWYDRNKMKSSVTELLRKEIYIWWKRDNSNNKTADQRHNAWGVEFKHPWSQHQMEKSDEPHVPATLFTGTDSRCPQYRGLDVSQSPSGRCGEEKYFCMCQESNHGFRASCYCADWAITVFSMFQNKPSAPEIKTLVYPWEGKA
jgi:hypothetical protein